MLRFSDLKKTSLASVRGMIPKVSQETKTLKVSCDRTFWVGYCSSPSKTCCGLWQASALGTSQERGLEMSWGSGVESPG